MMTIRSRCSTAIAVLALTLSALTGSARAQSPQQFAPDATRYMALGDSLAAGFKAMPATRGYPYLLYEDGVFDTVPHTLFCNSAVPGATSADVLHYQVPQAIIPVDSGGFDADYVTLSVGGNDLLAILRFAGSSGNPDDIAQFAQQVLTTYAQNLGATLAALHQGLPGVQIFVANQYTIPELQAVIPITDQIIDAFNGVVTHVVNQSSSDVHLVDVHSAFQGRNGLLLVERHGSSQFEVHPTTLGHREMERAFAGVIATYR
jgi:lysophospholipase L1-like esterase